MNCPACGNQQSKVLEQFRIKDGFRRHRICSGLAGCGQRFGTVERVEEWDPNVRRYSDEPEPVALKAVATVVQLQREAPPVAARSRASARHEASSDEECLAFVCAEARHLLVQWWNESRKSKHRANATWTRAAWMASVERVANMPTDLQLTLCRAGVEHGWQALKLDYIKEELAKPTAAGRPMPKDPSMRAALESWPKPA